MARWPSSLKNTAEAVRQTTTIAQQAVNTGEETRRAAKEAATVGKTTLQMIREMKVKGLQSQIGPATYAVGAAQGQAAESTQNIYTKSQKTPRANAT